MKTNLNRRIDTVGDAKQYLSDLHRNGEAYHPDDNATEIYWPCEPPTAEEARKMNLLMEKVHTFDFCPFQYILNLGQ